MSTSASTTTNPSFEEIEVYDTEQIVTFLRKNLNLTEDNFDLASVNPGSPHSNIIPGRTRQDTRNQNSDQSSNRRGSRDSKGSRGPSQDPKTEMQELTYGYTEFKLKGILGCGQTGRTFKAIFHGESVAMKAIDLFKEANLLRRIQREIDIYKKLIKIQERYIPKLICYGYYGYGMGYFMCVTIVGTTLNHHSIDCNQRDMAFEALRAIHSHGILHNDIQEENILVNEQGEIYIIDFGMSFITDNSEHFYEEECDLSNLLDRYM
jgi:predicted Ser/Thr protein kinase